MFLTENYYFLNLCLNYLFVGVYSYIKMYLYKKMKWFSSLQDSFVTFWIHIIKKH